MLAKSVNHPGTSVDTPSDRRSAPVALRLVVANNGVAPLRRFVPPSARVPQAPVPRHHKNPQPTLAQSTLKKAPRPSSSASPRSAPSRNTSVSSVVSPPSSTGLRWWLDLSVGLIMRIMGSVPSITAPVVFLVRHAWTILRSLVLLALPALISSLVYHYVPGLSESYPLLSVGGALYAVALYATSAFALLLIHLLLRRVAVESRRVLNDLALEGARLRSSGEVAGKISVPSKR